MASQYPFEMQGDYRVTKKFGYWRLTSREDSLRWADVKWLRHERPNLPSFHEFMRAVTRNSLQDSPFTLYLPQEKVVLPFQSFEALHAYVRFRYGISI